MQGNGWRIEINTPCEVTKTQGDKPCTYFLYVDVHFYALDMTVYLRLAQRLGS